MQKPPATFVILTLHIWTLFRPAVRRWVDQNCPQCSGCGSPISMQHGMMFSLSLLFFFLNNSSHSICWFCFFFLITPEHWPLTFIDCLYISKILFLNANLKTVTVYIKSGLFFLYMLLYIYLFWISSANSSSRQFVSSSSLYIFFHKLNSYQQKT